MARLAGFPPILWMWMVIGRIGLGFVIDKDDGACKDLGLVLRPLEFAPTNAVRVGYSSVVHVPFVDRDGELHAASGCEASDLRGVLPESLNDQFFLVFAIDQACSIKQRMKVAEELGASGILLVDDEKSNKGREDLLHVRRKNIRVPFAILSHRDWKHIKKCQTKTLIMDVLGQDVIYWSYSGILQWTLLRGAAFWFSLQVLIFFASKFQRSESIDSATQYFKAKRSQLIQRLTSVTFHKKSGEVEGDETCAICLEELDEGDECRLLFCSHVYHINCIDAWLNKSNDCPLCKRSQPLLLGTPVAGYGATDAYSDTNMF